MVKSSFSGLEIPPGRGIIYAEKDGKTHYFLSQKEKSNFLKKKYKPHKTKWTKIYQLEKQRTKPSSKKSATK